MANQNGKGSSPRNIFSEDFRSNYDDINWETRKTSYQWMKEKEYSNIVIIDYDGWDRLKLDESLSEKITKKEFDRRLGMSTSMNKFGDNGNPSN